MMGEGFGGSTNGQAILKHHELASQLQGTGRNGKSYLI